MNTRVSSTHANVTYVPCSKGVQDEQIKVHPHMPMSLVSLVLKEFKVNTPRFHPHTPMSLVSLVLKEFKVNTPRFHPHMPMSLMSLVLKEFKVNTPRFIHTCQCHLCPLF